MEDIQSALSKLSAIELYLTKYKDAPLVYQSQLKTFAAEGKRGYRAPISKDSVVRAREEWNQALASQNYILLSKRTVRILCSLSDVVVTRKFIEFLKGLDWLTPSMITSLLGIYHLNWNQRHELLDLETLLRGALLGYQGRSAVINKWQALPDFLLGNEAPSKTSVLLLEPALKKVDAVFAELEVSSSQTPFGGAVVLQAASKLSGILSVNGFSQTQWSFLLYELCAFVSLKKGHREAILADVIKLVDAQHRAKSGWLGALSELKDFTLKHPDFGDPRVHNLQWEGVDKKAREIFTGWLSEEDLTFFFELIIRKDPHSRKKFWLNYVNAIKNSFVLVGETDAKYHKSALAHMRLKGRNFGTGTGIDTSAFIMTFGKYVIVEFSEVNNACYMYETADFEKLFGSIRNRRNDLRQLKDRELAKHTQAHYTGWPLALSKVLAMHGIDSSK